MSWMCKKQTSVSQRSTESEIISLDAGLSLDGIPALDSWDLIVLVLGNTTQNHDRTGKLVVCRDKNHVRHQSRGVINVLDNVDFVPSNVRFSHQEPLLYVFEDNEAVIRMIIKGRSPTMRHVSRTHRVALDWLFDRINLDPQIQIKKNDTKSQLADMLTKGNFTRDEWNHLWCLFNISHFSFADCSEVMWKRAQKESGEEGVTAKSRPMMSLIARSSERPPSAPSSTASESPTRQESQSPLSAQAEMYDRTVKPVLCRDENHVRPIVVCSVRTSQTRFSRDSTNFNVEDEINHDRTGKPVVCPREGALQTRFLVTARTLMWKTKQITIERGNLLFAVMQITSAQC